jgi:hypothetical protein
MNDYFHMTFFYTLAEYILWTFGRLEVKTGNLHLIR